MSILDPSMVPSVPSVTTVTTVTTFPSVSTVPELQQVGSVLPSVVIPLDFVMEEKFPHLRQYFNIFIELVNKANLKVEDYAVQVIVVPKVVTKVAPETVTPGE